MVVALGCSSSSSEPPTGSTCAISEVERLDIEIGRDACPCDWEDQGFDSEADCRADNQAYLDSPIIDLHFACLCEGAAFLGPVGVRGSECVVEALVASAECRSRAGCDVDACEVAEDAAIDACDVLTPGEADRLLAEYDTCMVREVVGPSGTCPDEAAVDDMAFATTFRRGDDSQGSCGGDGADVAFTWIAPEDGTYNVALSPNDPIHEVVLYVLDGCDGLELGCDAPFDSGLTANVEIAVTSGRELVIVADGDDIDDAGEVELWITRLD